MDLSGPPNFSRSPHPAGTNLPVSTDPLCRGRYLFGPLGCMVQCFFVCSEGVKSKSRPKRACGSAHWSPATLSQLTWVPTTPSAMAAYSAHKGVWSFWPERSEAGGQMRRTRSPRCWQRPKPVLNHLFRDAVLDKRGE